MYGCLQVGYHCGFALIPSLLCSVATVGSSAVVALVHCGVHGGMSGMAFGAAGWGSGSSGFGGALCILLRVSQGLGIVCLGLGVLLHVGSFAFLVTLKGLCAAPGPNFVCL